VGCRRALENEVAGQVSGVPTTRTLRNTSAFVGTYPTDESITCGSLVIRSESHILEADIAPSDRQISNTSLASKATAA
jgi:hypothetical protein